MFAIDSSDDASSGSSPSRKQSPQKLRIAGAPAGKIRVIPNGVDMERFRPPSPQERAGARASLGIAPEEIVHLFFGRDRHIKGADTLWRAMDHVPGRTLVVVVGASRETLAELRRRSRVIDVASVADTRPLFWASDSIVVPSRGEGSPYVLVEALASGLPAVITAIPPLLDVTAGIANRRAMPVDDHAALATMLGTVTLLRLPARPQTIERYNLNHWVRRTTELYATTT